MSELDATVFDRAAMKAFSPLAVNAKLTMEALGGGVYEVQGKEFTMRIRRGTGHARDILVTVLPTGERPADHDDMSKEIGLGVVAEFGGQCLSELPFDTEEECQCSAVYLANEADKLIMPFLLGTRNDFGELKEFVAARVEAAQRDLPDYRFPKNVRKEWV